MTDYSNAAQMAIAAEVLRESGMPGAQVDALFAADMARVFMRLNTRGGTVEEHQQRVLRDRRASLVEVACYLFNLRVPPDPHKPKAQIRRRVHCRYTLANYIPGFLAACFREHPEDAAFYQWAAERLTGLCQACLSPADQVSGKRST